jgi:flagellar hook-associated protein 1 FlgK
VSTFSGLSTALSALYAQRRGLDVTGLNIANANTDGYSRQRVTLTSVGGATVPAVFSHWDGAGGGVAVEDVERLRDQFLEARARGEHAQNAYLSDQQRIYGQVEQIFNEPSDTGLQSQLADFWSSWHEVANRPGDLAARTQLLQRASTIADNLHTSQDTLGALWTATREQLGALTTEVNTATANVAQLNQAVVRANQAGLPANELADQRDQAVLHLSELTGSTARVRDDGAVDVYLNGSSLVSGAAARKLAVAGATRLEDQSTTPVSLRWADDGNSAIVTKGTAASALEALNTTIPAYTAALDGVAASLASTVNAQHAAGYDLAGAAGGQFYSGTTAATLTVAVTDPSKVAAAAGPGGSFDGTNADTIAHIAASNDGPDKIYRQLVVGLGVVTQGVNRRATIQSVVTDDVDSARSSESGVNLDEEMSNMLAYQRGYEAASRVMNAVDSMLDTLINRTGLVGR